MCVKRIFATSIFCLALFAVSTTSAQSRGHYSASQSGDTVLLSKYADGDYTVSRVLVRSDTPATAQYDVRYAINNSVMSASTANNASELNDMADFVGELPADTLLRVQTVVITGYASPDGPQALNRNLAAARARNFAAYLDKNYKLSSNYKVVVNSEPLDWTACRDAVAASSVPSRSEVLAIIDGNLPHSEKEARLKRLPGVWDYLAANILPPMRRADVTMTYGRDRLLTLRTLDRKCDPAPARLVSNTEPCPPATDSSPCGCQSPCRCGCVVEDEVTGIIIEMVGNPER